jgi:hypothetical protein
MAFLLVLGASLALPLRARAGDIRLQIYNTSPNKVWVTVYRKDIGRTIVCSGWAEPRGWKVCNPWFIGMDNGMWVRAEVVAAGDKVIRDIEIQGSPRTLSNTTVKYKDGDFRIVAGAP